MGVELPLRVVVTILECCVTFSGVKLSIRSFVLFAKKARSSLRDFEGSEVSDGLFKGCEKFVCALYGGKGIRREQAELL